MKQTEIKLDSVRKEREAGISIIEGIVKETFTSREFSPDRTFASIKIYGSMAYKLAIE